MTETRKKPSRWGLMKERAEAAENALGALGREHEALHERLKRAESAWSNISRQRAEDSVRLEEMVAEVHQAEAERERLTLRLRDATAEASDLAQKIREDRRGEINRLKAARDDARNEGQHYLTLLNAARAALDDTDFEVAQGQSLANRLHEMVTAHNAVAQEAATLRRERNSAENLARGGWWSFAAVLVAGVIHWLFGHTGGAR